MLEQPFEKQELRVAAADASLESALNVMHDGKSSAVVAKIAGVPTVLTAAMLVEAVRRYGPATPVAEVRFFGLPIAKERGRQAEERRGHSKLDFAVIDLGPEFALVVPASEASSRRLRQPLTICRCMKDPSHVWLPHELSTPGRCELDGSPVDCS